MDGVTSVDDRPLRPAMRQRIALCLCRRYRRQVPPLRGKCRRYAASAAATRQVPPLRGKCHLVPPLRGKYLLIVISQSGQILQPGS
jgi:hypothetical protein